MASIKLRSQQATVFGLGMCALVNIYSTQPVLVEIGQQFMVSATRSAWTISSTTLGIALMAPIAGAVSDRLGRKQVISSAAALMTIATFACGLAWSFAALLALRFVQGALTPFVFAVAVAYIAEEWEGRASTLMNSIYVAGTAFGGFYGRFVSGAVVGIWGWRSTFFALSGVPLLVLAAVFFFLPRERNFKRSPALLSGVRRIGEHLSDWRLLATCVIGAALLLQQVASFTYAGLRLVGPPFNYSSLKIGLIFGIFLVAAAIAPLVGEMAARFGRRTTWSLCGALGAGGLLLTLSSNAYAIVSGLTLSCTAVFAGQVCATGFVAAHWRESRSSAVGLYLTFYYLGGSVGGVAPARLYASYGWSACVALLVVVSFISILAAAAAWRRT